MLFTRMNDDMSKQASGIIEIVLVDERPMTRWALRISLEPDPRFVVTGEADSEDKARAVVARLKPDVVVVSAHDGDGPELVRAVLGASPESRVIVLRPVESSGVVSDLISAGVRAYLLSKAMPEELAAAIDAVCSDDDRVVLSVPRHCLPSSGGRRPDTLSTRELDVLGLVAEGLSNAQIGRRLLITEATVKRHLQNAYRKLGATSRLDAVNRACSSGLIEAPRVR